MNGPQLPQAALGYIRGHGLDARFADCVEATLLYDQHTWNVLQNRVLKQFCAHYLNVGRNAVVRRFLDETDAQVLVKVDTDNTWEPVQLMRLLACVDAIERGKRILLKAEMKLPGRAWLQFDVDADCDKYSVIPSEPDNF